MIGGMQQWSNQVLLCLRAIVDNKTNDACTSPFTSLSYDRAMNASSAIFLVSMYVGRKQLAPPCSTARKTV